ncbi:MAG: hypothetical protein V7K50_01935 [Nostoc sp.]|uniref:hypothetical protein n=1 Tax=Nostoc sp. TaxID=1180 RepID=UPI002FFB9281
MNNLVTCIECGHYPVSSKAYQCPKCSNNPYGHSCKFCNTNVADSQAIVDKENIQNEVEDYDIERGRFTNRYVTVEYNYFHSSCLNQINTIQYNCPTCSILNTSFNQSCFKCGHPFKAQICTHCRRSVLEALAVKNVSVLGENKYFHRICANKIRPNWQVEEAEAQAKAKAKEERARYESEQAKIKARQQEEEKLRQEEEKINLQKRQAFLKRIFSLLGIMIGYSLIGFLLGKVVPVWLLICVGLNLPITYILLNNSSSELQFVYQLGSSIGIAWSQWQNTHNIIACIFSFMIATATIFPSFSEVVKRTIEQEEIFIIIIIVTSCIGFSFGRLLQSIF